MSVSTLSPKGRPGDSTGMEEGIGLGSVAPRRPLTRRRRQLGAWLLVVCLVGCTMLFFFNDKWHLFWDNEHAPSAGDDSDARCGEHGQESCEPKQQAKVTEHASQLRGAPTVLVTGGLGFIGSHTVLELLLAQFNVVVIDNLINAKEDVKGKVEALSGRSFDWYNLDLLNYENVEWVFNQHNFNAVIHFAALKAVGESVAKPLMYYHHNLVSTTHVLKAMERHNCTRMVFSSSACVYGVPEKVPLEEKDTKGPVGDMGDRLGVRSVATNPYGNTKVIIERMLEDIAQNPGWDIISLRYFNPVGAHPSGCIGEDPNGIPNNLMPFLLKVVTGAYKEINVYGTDYDTKDGTGVRDYIHVVDLAQGHVAALKKMMGPAEDTKKPYAVYNLGSGSGFTVLEMIAEMEKASGQKIQTKMSPRRPGDVPENYADATEALTHLRWRTKLNMTDMCRDAWRFVQGKCDLDYIRDRESSIPRLDHRAPKRAKLKGPKVDQDKKLRMKVA